jgi:hypothetical protein
MKTIIAEVFRLKDGTLLPQFYCVEGDGQVSRAVTDTLLDLIGQAHPHEDELERWVKLAQSGGYKSPNGEMPDWGVNDTNIWLVAPMAQPGHVCIANENSGEFSTEEGGQPQQFTYEQFHAALSHWREFQKMLAREGKENLVGRRYEAVLP